MYSAAWSDVTDIGIRRPQSLPAPAVCVCVCGTIDSESVRTICLSSSPTDSHLRNVILVSGFIQTFGDPVWIEWM